MSDRSPPSPLHVVGAAILDGPRCLVAQRGPAMSEAGRWEFPGGKVEAGESPSAALVRELREELGVGIEVGAWLGRGEAIVGSRKIVLDVFAAARRDGEPRPREHAALRWITAEEVDALAWPEADRPILPILRRVLARGGRLAERPLARPIPIVSVDWAKGAAKRAVYTAQPDRSRWRFARATPPAAGWSLEAVRSLAETLGAPFGGACLVAIDAVLGLPARFGEATGSGGFLAALEALATGGALDGSVREVGEWSRTSPFFRVGAGRGGLTRFVERAGGEAMLYRQIERATGAKSAFATAGIPGTVGSGTQALWRELLALGRAGVSRFRLWPFEIELEDVADSDRPVLAESYPRACQAIALAAALPASPAAFTKTRESERIRQLRALVGGAWQGEASRPGAWTPEIPPEALAAAERGEDDFDALLQAVALARLVEAGAPLASLHVDPVWEGGILGTGGLVLPAPRGPRASRARR